MIKLKKKKNTIDKEKTLKADREKRHLEIYCHLNWYSSQIIEMKGETDESTIILIVQDFNTPLLELLNSKSVRIQKNNTVN